MLQTDNDPRARHARLIRVISLARAARRSAVFAASIREWSRMRGRTCAIPTPTRRWPSAVLADPTRAQVVHLLLHQDLCSCDLAAALNMSAPRVSQHLRVLRAAHIVKTRREGKFVIYSLDDAHVRLLFQLGLAHTGEPEVDTAVADIG